MIDQEADSEKAYKKAEERIARAKERGSRSLTISHLPLKRLPPMGGLVALRELSLWGTDISDLSEIAALPRLAKLSVLECKVTDLSPLSSLKSPRRLYLWGNPVSDVSPLEKLVSLTHLFLSGTGVSDVEPLRALVRLRELSLSRTRVSQLNSLSRLSSLEELDLRNTSVVDLSVVSNFKKLRALRIDNTRVVDLSALEKLSQLELIGASNSHVRDLTSLSGLRGLSVLLLSNAKISSLEGLPDGPIERLDLDGTQVDDISSLIHQPNLEDLVLKNTPVQDISSLSRMASLRTLDISDTKVSDISALAGAPALWRISLDRSPIKELGPLSECQNLYNISGRYPKYYGVSFFGCPISDRDVLDLAESPNRTVEVIDLLRAKQGLPPYSQDDDQVDGNIELSEKFKQNPLGAHFAPLDDVLAMSIAGGETDQSAADDLITKQLLPPMRSRAAALANQTQRLGNQPGWLGLASTSARFQALIEAEVSSIAEQIGVVWIEVATLASFVEQDDRILQGKDQNIDPLEASVRRSLEDLIQIAGTWVRRFPSARLLDNEYSDFHSSRQSVSTAREVVLAARHERIIKGDDASILSVALESSTSKGNQSKKASGFAVVSVRNLVIGAIGVVATAGVTGFTKKVGEVIADKSVLASRAERLLLSKEEEMVRFLDGLPSDIRGAARSVLEGLKQKLAKHPIRGPDSK